MNNPPVISCAPDKTVIYGTDWSFDAPTARAVGAVDTLIYDNSVHDLSYRFDPGPLEVGNEIILTGSARYASQFSFEFWGSSKAGYDFEGDVQARVRFYRSDGSLSSSGYASPGTVIYDSGCFPIPATPAGRATLIFDEFQIDAVVPLSTPLPDSFTWTVQFSGLSTNDSAGVDLYAPPVLGGTYSDYWENDTGQWNVKTNAVPMEFAARLSAVSQGVSVTVLLTVTNAGCGNGFSATRTWGASDACGNSATCSQTVTVVDNPPVISCAPDKTVIYGTDWTFDAPTATAAGAVDTLVYDNSVHDLSYRFDPGPLEVGNEIILGGSARYASQFSFEFWGSSKAGYDFEGDVQARVRFYGNDGPLSSSGYASPGTVIYDSGSFPIPATPAGRATLIFDEFQIDAVVPLRTPLPNSFTWTVQFSGLSTNDSAGVDLYAPPVLGNTYDDYWENDTGQWNVKTNAVPMEFAARFSAVSQGVSVTVLSTVTNAGCGNGFSATRTWGASDACGNSATCSQTVQLVDQGPPVIVSQPQDMTVVAGQGGVLEVSVTSCPPLGYQWYFNQTNVVANATNATLELTSVVPGEAGGYEVAIANGYGSVTSSPAVLSVIQGGSGTAAPAIASRGLTGRTGISTAVAVAPGNPKAAIASPPFVPWLSIEVSAGRVKVTRHVVRGNSYVLESSTNLSTWTPIGSQFTAQEEVVTQEFDVDGTGRFFRIRHAP